MRRSDEEKLMFLEALEETGVDNWDGYEEAVALYTEMLEESEED